MWKEGSLKIHDSVFHYWMKQYDEGSEFGIEGGRISKLMLKRNGEVVCNYDRGWDRVEQWGYHRPLIKPYVQFSRIRLSDILLPSAFSRTYLPVPLA